MPRLLSLLLVAVAAGVADAVCESWCNQCAHCFRPPFPRLSPYHLTPVPRRSADTCVHNAASCGTCAVCDQITAGTYCASWCNDYTCSNNLCAGCSACDYLDTGGTRCLDWRRCLSQSFRL